MNGVICYLIINKIPNLPLLAVSSALKNTISDIYIGFIHSSDLEDLPTSDRLHFVNLSSHAKKLGLSNASSGYVDFDQDYFFKLVQLKWSLFKEISQMKEVGFATYLDLDVIVIKDFMGEFEKVYSKSSCTNFIVQDFTFQPSTPRLCMGIFSFRNNQKSRDLLVECENLHAARLEEFSRCGDDDVITEIYSTPENGLQIHRLPQQSFPVGNLANLYLPLGVIPGLRPESPFVYHANFVVGNLKKTLLLTIFSGSGKINTFEKIFPMYCRIFLGFAARKSQRLFVRLLLRRN